VYVVVGFLFGASPQATRHWGNANYSTFSA